MISGLKQLFWVMLIIIGLFLSFLGMYELFEKTIRRKDETGKYDLPIRYTAQHGNSEVSPDTSADGK